MSASSFLKFTWIHFGSALLRSPLPLPSLSLQLTLCLLTLFFHFVFVFPLSFSFWLSCIRSAFVLFLKFSCIFYLVISLCFQEKHTKKNTNTHYFLVEAPWLRNVEKYSTKASLRILIYKNKFGICRWTAATAAIRKSLDLDYRRMCLYSFWVAFWRFIAYFFCAVYMFSILHVFTKLTN